jgi:tetratricopeptide (TPR) repeat protein
MEAAHDVAGQSWVLLRLGQLERERHQLATAEQQLRTGLHLARQQQDKSLEAQFLAELGIVHNCLDQYEQGKSFLLEALPLARLAAADSLPNILEELGILALMAGDRAGAAHHYEEGLALVQAKQNEAQAVMFLKSLGALCHLQGEAAQAKTLLAQGYALAQQLRFHKGVMLLANNLAVVLFVACEMARAEELLQVALQEAERLADADAAVLIELNLAYWARHNGRFAQAQHHFRRVLTIAEAQERVDIADKVQAELEILAVRQGLMEKGVQERPLPPTTEHLKVFI